MQYLHSTCYTCQAALIAACSSRGVDPQLVSFNRTVLLHGPPGTGKTSMSVPSLPLQCAELLLLAFTAHQCCTS